MRKLLALAAGVAILAAANWTIYGRERLLADGRVVLLELAPVDPRSLMQGDYMALRFAVGDALQRSVRDGADGRVIVRLDERGVGRFARRDEGAALGEREVALRYRVREGRVKFATNAFFFQEGHAGDYVGARFGEFRVAPSGELLLTGLRGRDLEPLGPARR
ncbi:MAG TPA: GDYXXLXY domain-containing protein [Ideonella sp.]|nr:GDYXXLXY domain-containing protein [Ideonella sp.]